MISFCIITDGKEPDKLQRQVDSIWAIRDLPEFQIVIAGSLPYEFNHPAGQGITYVPMKHTAKQGRLGALRNGACQAARGELLVVSDDDMEFMSEWWEGVSRLYWGPMSPTWDVMSCRILNPDGTRYWDWKCHENGMNWLLDYKLNDTRVSLTGGLTIMKRRVFEAVQWNNELGFNQAEDVDFSNRVKAAGFKIVFNPESTIIHHGPYTQIGMGVHRL
jgi:hypothetical protein